MEKSSILVYKNEIHSERIDWCLMSEEIFTKNRSIQILKPLSSNLYCLLKTAVLESKFSWSNSEIFILMEEITSTH